MLRQCHFQFAVVANLRGWSLSRLGRDGESLLAFRSALHYFELMGPSVDQFDVIGALANIGLQLREVGQNDEALAHLRLA